MVETAVQTGLTGQALQKGLLGLRLINPRKFTQDAHHTVDDRAFGGGDGMVMKVEPLAQAVAECQAERVVVLSPQGRVWNQSLAREWAESGKSTALVCGRYAGIDHRFTVRYAHEEISLGDFILNGGELAACAIIESVARLLPGVLGNEASARLDSFSAARLECPQFTRPRDAAGLPVPAPLLSGDHARIREFESAVALVRTFLLRPDLIPERPENFKRQLALVTALSDDELLSLGLNRAALKGCLP